MLNRFRWLNVYVEIRLHLHVDIWDIFRVLSDPQMYAAFMCQWKTGNFCECVCNQ